MSTKIITHPLHLEFQYASVCNSGSEHGLMPESVDFDWLLFLEDIDDPFEVRVFGNQINLRISACIVRA